MKIYSVLLAIIFVSAVYGQTSIILNTGCKSLSKDGKTCELCSNRYYRDQSGICQPVSASCQTFSATTGGCTSCYSGYTLLESICFLGRTPASPLNPFCSQFNGTACTQCSKGYYLSNSECLLIDPLCKSFSLSSLRCEQCYIGFDLKSDGTCVVSETSASTTEGCAQFNNSLCVRCSKGYYFENNTTCRAIDPLCKTFDLERSVCTTCYVGFQLESNSCVLQGQGQNCKEFDAKANCLVCNRGYYLSQGQCLRIDSNCRKFDVNTSRCNECYGGYTLRENACINSNSLSSEIAGLEACAQWLEGVCVKCVPRGYIDFEGNCALVSDSCNTFEIFSGDCTSCYGGFALKDGKCILDETRLQSNCASFDVTNKICTRCYNGSFLNTKSQCQKMDTQCQTFNLKTLICDQCYRGYGVNARGGCEQVVIVTSSVIQNCVEIDANGKCLRCFNLYYLSENVCRDVNPLCKTFDAANGKCTTCFNGFTLNKEAGQCNFD